MSFVAQLRHALPDCHIFVDRELEPPPVHVKLTVLLPDQGDGMIHDYTARYPKHPDQLTDFTGYTALDTVVAEVQAHLRDVQRSRPCVSP